MILAAAGCAGTLALEGCGGDPGYTKPLYIANDKVIPGADYWRATVCGQCDAGCGVIVRTRDGNANKIEGNPLHPVNRGKLCARGQAGLNELYNPDRLRGPLRLNGARGSGSYEPINWDEALKILHRRLDELRTGGGRFAWIEGGGTRGVYGEALRALLGAYGSDRLIHYRPFSRGLERRAAALAFGVEGLPVYNLARADYVLSFGARFLETWASPLHYSRGYGEMRRGRAQRGRFVHAEPRLSLTAASADEWLPVRPGSEGYLALALAAELDRAAKREATGPAPEQVEEVTGIAPARIKRLAAEIAAASRVVVLGGDAAAAHSNGIFNLLAIHHLGSLVPGGGALAGPVKAEESEKASETMHDFDPSGLGLLLIHRANPLYGAPEAFKLREKFGQIPFIVSFSPFIDETSSHADLILPDHASFEKWGDDRPEVAPALTRSFAQPVIDPLYDTRDTGDLVLALIGRAKPGGPSTILDRLKAESPPKAEEADQEWEQSLLRGGRWDESNETTQERRAAVAPARLDPVAPAFAGEEKDYPFHFLPYEHFALGDGGMANQPLLQELSDPLTAVVWGSWVEINPQTAGRLGIEAGDLVAIESPHGRIEAPAVLFPAIRPDTIAMPSGQGHERYGRYASGRGANPLRILAPMVEPETGTLLWAATRVRVTKTGARGRLVTVGTNERLLEDREDLIR